MKKDDSLSYSEDFEYMKPGYIEGVIKVFDAFTEEENKIYDTLDEKEQLKLFNKVKDRLASN